MSVRFSHRHWAFVSAALLGLAACSSADENQSPAATGGGASTTGTGGNTTTGGTQAQVRSDAEIASVLRTVNIGEIQESNVAVSQAANMEVREFAQDMIDDHTDRNKDLDSLLTELAIAPTDNELSRTLSADSSKNVEMLKQKTGAAFDIAYLDRQVAVHQNVLSLLDKELIPNAKQNRLRDFLTEMRGDISEHVADATELRAKLGNNR